MQTSTIVAPKATSGGSTALTAIGAYTPAASAVVSSLVIANTFAGAITVSVTLYNGTTDYYLAKNAPLSQGDSLMVGGADAKFTLVNGWYIRYAVSAGGLADASMCVVEAS